MEVADETVPTVANALAASNWVNQTATSSISAEGADTGLGVKSLSFEVVKGSPIVATNPCLGTASSPCPRHWSASVSPSQYNPANMPQGLDFVPVTAQDVVGNKVPAGSEVNALIRVDHTAPELTLSGTATEQATLGTKNPTYTIKAKATDGVAGAPQSGIYKAKIEIDGTQVAIKEPKCATENCTAEPGYTIEASKYSTGQHTIKVTAEDTVGLTTTKELKITLNATPPSITLSGPATEQATFGATRPRYKLHYTAVEGTGTASPPRAGLVAAYSFDEGSGTTVHDSTGIHNAKIEGAEWTTGKYGSALKFNASKKAQLTVPDSEDLRLKEFTLEAWVSPEESRNLAPLIAKTEPNGYGYALYAGGDGAAGHPEGYQSNQEWVEAYVYDEEGLTLNHWSHVALTDDGKHLDLIVNGAIVAEGSAAAVQAGDGPLTIGGDEPFAEGGYFDGKIDEVRVYERALSPTEVRGDKNTAIQSPASGPPVAAYSFDEGAGTTVQDASGHHHEATIKGAKWASGGKFSGGMEFKASEKAQLTIPDSEDLRFEKFTLEAQVSPSEAKIHAPIFSKVSTSGYGYMLDAGGSASGRPEGILTKNKATEAAVASPSALTNNAWAYVVLTDDGENLRLYVNNELKATHSAKEVEAGTGNLTIGGTEALGSAEFFSGKLDNLRLYNRVLSSAQMAKDGESPIGTSPTETYVPSGIASTEVIGPGGILDSSLAKCSSENCFISREFPIKASQLSFGKSTITVRATDNFGNVTTKTLTMERQADTSKPTIALSGELFTAPEGWVEQDNYSFKAEATDPGGYGVTSEELRIDGSTVASTTASCPDGGCPLTLQKPVNTAAYSGGAHTATVVATDGAGNTATKEWTINVDPEGHITTTELEATLEAVEGTSPVNPVGPAEEEEAIEGTLEGLELVISEEGAEATGTATPVEIKGKGESGPCSVELQAVPGELLEETPETEKPSEAAEEGPLGTQGEAGLMQSLGEASHVGGNPVEITRSNTTTTSCQPVVVEDTAAIEANTGTESDSVVRPLYDGSLTFQAIRGPTAPESYSWRIVLQEGQVLKLNDEQHAEVYYEEGTPAMAITAIPAHDATGAAVPTSLGISEGDVVTLTVHYRSMNSEGKPFVYPVLGGASFQVGYSEVLVGYRDEEEVGEEEVEELEALASGHVLLAISTFGPPEDPEPVSAAEKGQMEITSPEKLVKEAKHFRFLVCHPHKIPGEPLPIEGPDDHEATVLRAFSFHCHDPEYEGNYWSLGVRGIFHYVYHQRVWADWHQWECRKIGGDEVKYAEKEHCDAYLPNQAHYTSDKRVKGPIDTLAEFKFPINTGQFAGAAVKPTCQVFGGKLFPNPRKEPGHFYEKPLLYQRPFRVEPKEKCPPIDPGATGAPG